MPADPRVTAFRHRSAQHAGRDPWVTCIEQSAVWERLFGLVDAARMRGMSPVVCLDLDLTTLLAPQKSRDVLVQLAADAAEVDAASGISSGTFGPLLASIWQDTEPALLPGYTTTSIQAYGIYCTARLQSLAGRMLDAERLEACEAWITAKVHGTLRSGYWARDLSRDELAQGFADWMHRVTQAGARIVFLSNRDASLREVSLACIQRLIGEHAAPFAFFGPGGAALDASSKAVAVTLIERGVTEGVHFGASLDGQTVYPDAAPHGPPATIVAVVDDRAENRHQIIEASAGSRVRLAEAGLGGIMDIASAAQGFCPEVEVMGMSTVMSSFLFQENAC